MKAGIVNRKITPQNGIRSFFWKYRLMLLVLVPLTVYIKVVTLQFIGIDDANFIIKNKDYNKDVSNICRVFERGVFQPADKTAYDYYRPLFLVALITEYQLFGEAPGGYHFTSLLLHILSVILLYLFFKKVNIDETTSLILALLFAVHPAISHAVAWIPGQNDLLLMVFLLSCMIFSIDFAISRKWGVYALQVFFFLLAVFTKETAIIIPLLAFFILSSVLKIPWKSLISLCIGWCSVIVFWFFMESFVKKSGNRFPVDEMIASGLGRFPAILQYLGKTILPVNLSVHPQINEISVVWGILALAGICFLVISKGSYRKPLTLIGGAWFLLFLLPVLAVPKTFSDLVYEHRLYVPLAGIQLLLSHNVFLTGKLKGSYRFILFGSVILVFGVMSFNRAGYFSSPLSYWSRAVAETPRNAYSLQMMGTWVEDDAEQERILRQAYAIDPTLDDINLNLGKVAYKNKRLDEAEQFLKNELALPGAKDPENYFLLGQIAFEKKDYARVKGYLGEGLKISGKGDAEIYSQLAKVYFFEKSYDSAVINLRKVIELEPMNTSAHNNLVIIFMKLGMKDSAVARLQQIKLKGLRVQPQLIELVGGN
ncbi:MAG: glycosyltransferase family 39 protein [Bacteroidetes bacterium]|nr:glycosyltransferase family 39 protein [Bacteroidota bacterium]